MEYKKDLVDPKRCLQINNEYHKDIIDPKACLQRKKSCFLSEFFSKEPRSNLREPARCNLLKGGR
jgi:hypothetical protein